MATDQTTFPVTVSGVSVQDRNTDGGGGLSSANALRVANYPYIFNGTGMDRQVKPNATSRILSAANTTNAQFFGAFP